MTRALRVAALLALGACGGGAHGGPSSTPPPGFFLQPVATSKVPPAPQGPTPARNHLVGTVTRAALGPFLGRSPNGGIIAWISPAPRGGQQLEVVPLGQDGAPFGEPKSVASVPEAATSLVVRAAGGPHGGWLVAWTSLLDRGESLSVLGIGSDGTPRPSPFDVQRTTEHVKWVDIVPVATGGMCVWAEESSTGDANILAVPVDTEGKPRGLPARVARGVLGWSVVRDGDGIALALVSPGSDHASPAASLSWLRLDADGRARAAPASIGGKVSVNGEVDVVPVGSGWLLGWTDRAGEDPEIMLASVDAAGHVKGPRRAMDTVGGASLIALASGAAGTVMAWTEPRGRARPVRSLHLASVSMEGPGAQPVSSFDVSTTGAPEVVATEHGFGLLARAPVCTRDDGPMCSGRTAPSFVRLDARLLPVQTEPLLLGDTAVPATLGWGLGCLADTCVALAANGASPTGLYTVDLASRDSPYRAPTTPPLPPEAPRVTGISTLASGQPFTDFATLQLGDATLVATLSTVPSTGEAPRARGAAISVRPFDARGQPAGPAASITTRALPVGGVSLAPAGRLEDGALLAWVARDDGDPQVHLAHLDRRGHRTNEVQLTTDKGDASDVAVAWAGNGWMVAWVDGRDGNGEVYATKVDLELQRTAREERITRGPGDAGDVALLVRGELAWLTWSDPRESPREGLADIYVRTLHTRDARPAGDEIRVLPTAAHSRSPQLAPSADGALVAWIEDAPQGIDAHGTAMEARLDGTGHVVGMPLPLQLADAGEPNALVLVPGADGTRVLAARSNHSDVSIDALTLRPDGSAASRAWRLLDLDAPGSFDVVLSAVGDWVFFDDVGVGGPDHRVRRATVAWRR